MFLSSYQPVQLGPLQTWGHCELGSSGNLGHREHGPPGNLKEEVATYHAMPRKRTMFPRWVMTTLERYVFSLRFGSIEICFFNSRSIDIFHLRKDLFYIYLLLDNLILQFFLMTFYKGIFYELFLKSRGVGSLGLLYFHICEFLAF